MLYESIEAIKLAKSYVVLILILMEYALWDDVSSQMLSFELVLILILMEYALWGWSIGTDAFFRTVLILILMEYALWDDMKYYKTNTLIVLILILMEYALWSTWESTKDYAPQCLNPYSNGIRSIRLMEPR